MKLIIWATTFAAICLLLLFVWALCQVAGKASREEERREWSERRERLMREWGERREANAPKRQEGRVGR